ncbi:MAG: type IV pilus assembly protein PilM [Halomonas sp.]|nr:type IV pilus assembly protein PilM [Halomonas sp.]MBP5979401.1 type IV pilus assembly protein PilM [Halomonas sp.]
MRLLKASKELIGIDITSRSVKLLELKKRPDTYQVESFAVHPLPEGAVDEQRINNINDVSNSLNRAIHQARPTTRKAIVALPSSVAITKMLTLPLALNEQEIEEHIAVDSDQHIPFPFNEVAFDFTCLGAVPLAPHLQQVLLVACRQQDIWQMTETLDRAGLEPVAVDVDTFAIERVFAAMWASLPVDITAGVGLVDIGAHNSTLHVVHAGRIIYSRTGRVDGEPLTKAIQSNAHDNLPDDFQDAILNPFVDTLAQGIARALQLYYVSGWQPKVTHLVLTGRFSAIPRLAAYLAKTTGMTVTLANPLQHMQINKRLDRQALARDLPALLTASGLAMRVGA